MTQWSYDALDRLTNLSYPGGVQAIYGYGSRPDGRVSSVQVKLSSDASPINVATSISYLPFGPMTKFTHSNGLARTKAYDTDFWLSSIVTGSFQDITYDYNDRGEVTSIVFPSGSYNQAIQYDNIGRMKAVAATDPNAGAESITFTASGNRDLYTWEGQTDDYAYVGGNPVSYIDPWGLAAIYSPADLARITVHLNTVAGMQGDSFMSSPFYGPERSMLARLAQGMDDPQDLAFFMHEAKEADLCEAGKDAVDKNNPDAVNQFLKSIHEQTLSIQGNTSRDLYHPSVVQQYPWLFNSSFGP